MGLLVPALIPLTFHRYTGFEPPLTTLAVKQTLVPWQTTTEGFAVTVTLTGRLSLTVMVIALEVAGLFDVQTVIEDRRMQVTISPFNGV